MSVTPGGERLDLEFNHGSVDERLAWAQDLHADRAERPWLYPPLPEKERIAYDRKAVAWYAETRKLLEAELNGAFLGLRDPKP